MLTTFVPANTLDCNYLQIIIHGRLFTPALPPPWSRHPCTASLTLLRHSTQAPSRQTTTHLDSTHHKRPTQHSHTPQNQTPPQPPVPPKTVRNCWRQDSMETRNREEHEEWSLTTPLQSVSQYRLMSTYTFSTSSHHSESNDMRQGHVLMNSLGVMVPNSSSYHITTHEEPYHPDIPLFRCLPSLKLTLRVHARHSKWKFLLD